MYALIAILLMLALPAFAQEESADDAFDAFEDAFADFDEGFEDEALGVPLSGFVEIAGGRRLDADPNFSTRQTLGEVRARFETEYAGDAFLFTFRGDALYDDYESQADFEPRELNFQVSPGEQLDLKIGRQVLTWGTGDLLFLNDLFPKSWVSFFSGREDEYLKAPSDAVRATWYTNTVNIDVAWSPQFDPDEYLTGERFSFFSPLAGSIVAPHPPLAGIEPDSGIENSELAMRFFRTVGSTEYAAYLYRGFFKQPVGLNGSLQPIFPELSVYGASMRRPLGSGLVNAEFAYHESRDDPGGSNPLIPNDQFRLLVGYEFEAMPRFTVGLQYYLESTLDYGRLMDNSLAPAFEPDRNRHVLTNRLTWRSPRDELTLSLFTFYSPSDEDHYLRPSVSYRQSDQWTFTGGANLFSGTEVHTFFGQLEDNSNAWVRVRYNF
jgi:hypothetical protein